MMETTERDEQRVDDMISAEEFTARQIARRFMREGDYRPARKVAEWYGLPRELVR